jgi:hypothetical protein
LLVLLAAARRDGEVFDEAWPDAFRDAVRAAVPREPKDWRVALEDTVDAWQAAYERTDASKRVAAVAELAAAA